jgi:hypothetical protein
MSMAAPGGPSSWRGWGWSSFEAGRCVLWREQYPLRNALCAAVRAEITLTIGPEWVALRDPQITMLNGVPDSRIFCRIEGNAELDFRKVRSFRLNFIL